MGAAAAIAAVKEDMMTKRPLKAFCAAGLITVFAAVASPAHAADVECTVPFSFSVNGKTMPPGTYAVSTGIVQGTVLVRGFGRGAVSITTGLQSASDTDPKLVFHKYGDEYVLRQVWLGGGDGRMLPESRLERELKETTHRTASAFERVVVPAL